MDTLTPDKIATCTEIFVVGDGFKIVFYFCYKPAEELMVSRETLVYYKHQVNNLHDQIVYNLNHQIDAALGYQI